MTFIGSIPNPLRSIVSETSKSWGARDVYVACSGNFTIERTLKAVDPGFKIHSEDVSIYTTALGRWLAGEQIELAVSDDYDESMGWLKPYLDGDTGTLAALMLTTHFAADLGSGHPWRRRNVEGHLRQFEAMHAKTVTKLTENRFEIASYDCEDVRSWLGSKVPEDATVLSFPPFDKGGYEKIYERLDKIFDWPKPAYEILDQDGVDDVVRRIADRPQFLMGLLHEHDELAEHLISYVKPTLTARPFYVYAKSDTRTRFVVPGIKLEPVTQPRLVRGDDIGDRMTLAPLTTGQFLALRAKYLNAGIKTGTGNLNYPLAVLVDGKIIGAICFGMWKPGGDAELMLTTDFAVAPHDYPKLSKLVVMAALSKEAQRINERGWARRVHTFQTAVYSNAPVSMKYRGLFDLRERTELKPSESPFKYKLTYIGDAGRWTLEEALAEWKTRWGTKSQPRPDKETL